MWDMPTLLPHEVLQQELENKDPMAMVASWEKPPNYEVHPVVREARALGRPAVIPLSLFIDGVSYAKRDALLVVSMCNLLTDHRTVLCVVRKRLLCKCSCRGWETLRMLFQWLRWALEILRVGRHPVAKHDGGEWDPVADKSRSDMAGQELPFCGAVVQLRADWAEVAHTMAVPQWASHSHPCFLCVARHDNVYGLLPECNHEQMPWQSKTAQTTEAATAACEVLVEPLAWQDWRELQRLLVHDMRKDGGRGLCLRAPYRPLGLLRGDRLEPTATMPDVDMFLAGDPPASALFWRRSNESATLRRNPFCSQELGTDLPAVVAVDVMHTLCLGVHQQFLSRAMWHVLDKLPAEGPQPARNQASRHTANLHVLALDYDRWMRVTHRDRPTMVLTRVGDFSLEMFGKITAPYLKCKAHETLTMLRWAAEVLRKKQRLVPQGPVWASAGERLLAMWQRLESEGMVISDEIQQDHLLVNGLDRVG